MLFGINFIMDFIVLVLVNHVMKFAATNWKLLLSATFGALWSVVAVMIPETYKLLVNICTYILIGPLMIRICAGNNIKCVLKGTMALMGISIFLGGLLHFLYYNTYAGYYINSILFEDRMLMGFIGISVIVTGIMIRKVRVERQYAAVIRKIKCAVGDRNVELQALVDTGNSLTDPVTGKPVAVIEKDAMRDILNNIDDYTKVKYHLIPFRTVGCDDGMIEVITVDIMYIYDEKSTLSLKNVLVGLSDNRLSSQGRFQALINPQLYHES